MPYIILWLSVNKGNDEINKLGWFNIYFKYKASATIFKNKYFKTHLYGFI